MHICQWVRDALKIKGVGGIVKFSAKSIILIYVIKEIHIDRITLAVTCQKFHNKKKKEIHN